MRTPEPDRRRIAAGWPAGRARGLDQEAYARECGVPARTLRLWLKQFAVGPVVAAVDGGGAAAGPTAPVAPLGCGLDDRTRQALVGALAEVRALERRLSDLLAAPAAAAVVVAPVEPGGKDPLGKGDDVTPAADSAGELPATGCTAPLDGAAAQAEPVPSGLDAPPGSPATRQAEDVGGAHPAPSKEPLRPEPVAGGHRITWPTSWRPPRLDTLGQFGGRW